MGVTMLSSWPGIKSEDASESFPAMDLATGEQDAKNRAAIARGNAAFHRFMRDRSFATVDKPDTLALSRTLKAQGLDAEAEFAEPAVNRTSRCTNCGINISDKARLACGSCAS